MNLLPERRWCINADHRESGISLDRFGTTLFVTVGKKNFLGIKKPCDYNVKGTIKSVFDILTLFDDVDIMSFDKLVENEAIIVNKECDKRGIDFCNIETIYKK